MNSIGYNIIVAVCSILFTCVLAFIANTLNNRKIYKTSIEGSATDSIPIINLTYKNKTYRFLIDTGSTMSYIIPSIFNEVYDKESLGGIETTIHGNGGAVNVKTYYSTITFKFGRTKVTGKFYEGVNIVETLKFISNKYGTSLDGILGTDILRNNKFIVDYSRLLIYSK